jgi:ABC-2 type transport system permease protein
VHEIIDATSTPDWTFLVPKTLALALVLISTLLIGVVAGVATQTIKGYTDYELGKYLLWYVFPQSLSFLPAGRSGDLRPGAVAQQVRRLGDHGRLSDLDHRALKPRISTTSSTRYGAGIAVPLSDMNGRGDFAGFAAWLDAYWSAFAVILMVLAYALWRRGTESRLWPRLKRMPHRLAGPAGLIGGAALAAFVGLGVFIFLNTNVWNEYQTRDAREAEQAAYEKTLLRYEATPQPSVADVHLVMDLRPHQPEADHARVLCAGQQHGSAAARGPSALDR